MAWLHLIIESCAEKADSLSEQLSELGALSVTLVDAEDEPLFQQGVNETPLWEKTCIKALFPESEHIPSIIESLTLETNCRYRVEQVEDQDWIRKTQQDFPPQCFGNTLWVVPSWHRDNATPPFIALDPGLAFGTGTHPTTALCLTWLTQHRPQDLTVIDYGCGSGILSLAALALGAKTVYAVDHDPQALIATENNALLNDSIKPSQLKIISPAELPEIKADLIIANILANPLIELAPTLIDHTHPDTILLLSGLLNTEMKRVTKAYSQDFHVTQQDESENWLALTLASTSRH